MTAEELYSRATTWKARHIAQDVMDMLGRDTEVSPEDISRISRVQESEGGEPIPPPNENVTSAERLIKWEFLRLACRIKESERSSFFDPRNRDGWMDAFIDALRDKYQRPDRIASNE